MSTIVLIILVLLIVGALPHWPYAANWGYGYYPSGGLFIILILILLILLATGRPLWVY